jgi:hypothetical protein
MYEQIKNKKLHGKMSARRTAETPSRSGPKTSSRYHISLMFLENERSSMQNY